MAWLVKKKMNEDNSFYGQRVIITYAPDFETVDETRDKLLEWMRVVKEKGL